MFLVYRVVGVNFCIPGGFNYDETDIIGILDDQLSVIVNNFVNCL